MAKTLKQPTILLLGGSGFVGACFKNYAVNQGRKVYAPDSAACDLCDPSAVERFVRRLSKVDAIVCAAAAREDRESFAGAQKNTDIAFGCARLVELLRPAKLVYLSSVDVYGRPPVKNPVREESALNLDSPYAVSKFASENILRLACDRANAQCVVLRLPGVFGKGDNSNRIVAGMLRAARTKRVFVVNGDGRQRRDLVWNEDVARLICECLARKIKSCVWNAATGQSLSILQMNKIFRRLGVVVDLCFRKSRTGDFDLKFDVRRFLRKFTTFRFTSFEDAVSRMIANR